MLAKFFYRIIGPKGGFSRLRAAFLLFWCLCAYLLVNYFYDDAKDIWLNWQLSKVSVQTKGKVLNKRDERYYDQEGDEKRSYYISYVFDVTDANGRVRAFHNEKNVGANLFHAVNEADPIEIRYLPADPRVSNIVGNEPGIFLRIAGLIFLIIFYVFVLIMFFKNIS